MINWNKLPINKKFMVVLIMQNISFVLATFLFDVENILLFPLSLNAMYALYQTKKNWTKNKFFILSVITIFLWLMENNLALRTNGNVGYNQLKTYSGTTKANIGAGSPTQLLGDNLDNNYKNYVRFSCGLRYNYHCTKELNNYFGRGNTDEQNIAVKYYEFTDIVLPPFPLLENVKVIYEIRYNDKTIFDYDYFTHKHNRKHREAMMCAIYLVLTSLVFCIFYHLIQKKHVKHIQ